MLAEKIFLFLVLLLNLGILAHCAPHSSFVGETGIQKEVLGQCGLALVRKIPSTDLTYSADSKHVINL